MKACNETKHKANDQKAPQAQSTAELREASSLIKELKELMACGGTGAPTPTGLGIVEAGDAEPAYALPHRDKCKEPAPDRVEGGSTADFAGIVIQQLDDNGEIRLGEASVTTHEDPQEAGGEPTGARSSSPPTGSTTDEREKAETRCETNISTSQKVDDKREPAEARGINTSTGSVVQEVLAAFAAVTKQVVQALALQVVGTEEERVPESSGTMEGGEQVLNNWSVKTDLKAVNTAEVLEHHDTLVLVAVSDAAELVHPLGRE